MEGIQQATLNAFIKQCKKIPANFKLDEIIYFKDFFEDHLLDPNKKLDVTKYRDTIEYYDFLFAYFVLLQYENIDNIMPQFEAIAKNLKTKPNAVTEKKLPNGWSVIS